MKPTNEQKSAERPGLPVELGRIVATPAALRTLTETDIRTAIARHRQGNWGECCDEDARDNDHSLAAGFRLLSSYCSADGVRFWIITEADRSVTTILLPSDY